MRSIIIVATTIACLSGGIALAQSSTESTTSTQTTTAVPPPAVMPMPAAPTPLAPPPAGTLATESYSKKTDAYGNSEMAKKSTYRDSNGVAQDSQTTKTTVPVPPPVVSTTTSSSSTTTGIPQ